MLNLFCAILPFFSLGKYATSENISLLPPLLWIRPFAEGIVQHWQQTDVVYRAMNTKCRRQIILAPFLNAWHYPDVSIPINICRYFIFPKMVNCTSEPPESIVRRLQCSIVSCKNPTKWDCKPGKYGISHCKSFEHCGIKKNYEDVCTCKECLLSDLWTADNFTIYRGLYMKSMPIRFTHEATTLFKNAKSVMKLPDNGYTVVHWRRHGTYDNDTSINSPKYYAHDLIKLVEAKKQNSTVYVATNEVNKTDLAILKSNGYRLGSEFAEKLSLNTVETFIVDLQIAIESNVYLHWGSSSINRFVKTAKEMLHHNKRL